MANPKASINNEQIRFCFSISEISKLTGRVWSREISIHGVPWKILAYKTPSKAEPSLALFLYCTKPEETLDWSYVASATFELTSFERNCTANKFESDPQMFDHSNRYYGTNKLIKWDALVDANSNYVKDDTINLQIEVRAESSKATVTSFENITKSCDDGCLSTFRATVSNIEALTAAKTPEIILRKMPAKVILLKSSNHLGIKLLFGSRIVSFNTEMTVDLISPNAAVKRHEKIQWVIGRDNCCLHMRELISWDELLDPENGFIKDGAITIEFGIKTELLQNGSAPNFKKRKATDDHQPAAKHLKLECKICEKEIIDQDVSSLPCGHMFCSPCITESIEARNVCPSCDLPVTLNGLRRILLPKMD